MNMSKNIGKIKTISPLYIFLTLSVLLMIGGAFGVGFIDAHLENERKIISNEAYWRGYSHGYALKIADYKYWCEDKYGWIPQSECSIDKVCVWLSDRENQIYGHFSSYCFEWFQEQMYQLGLESQKSDK